MKIDNIWWKRAHEQGFLQFKITKTNIESLELSTFNDKLDHLEISNADTFLISALYNLHEVRLTTQYLDENIFELLKEQALLQEVETTPIRKKLEDIQETAQYHLNESTKILDKMLSFNKYREQNSIIKEINSYYTETITTTTLTTEDNELYDTFKKKNFLTEVVVTENGQNSTATFSQIVTENSPINMEEILQKTITNAIDKLHYQKIVSGSYQVIFTSKVMGQILDKFTGLFSADNIQKSTSLLVGKLNQQVFSNKITILEEPNNPTLPGKRLFDDTGAKTMSKKIIKNGVFIQPLYDDRTAHLDQTTTTTNDYGIISPRNLYIKKGTKSIEAIIKSVKKGILIDSVGGLHAGINPINGDISLQSEGYYIENGEQKFASILFVLSTNIMDILNNVIEISNNIETHLKTTSAPDLLVDNIKISQ